MKLDTMDNFYKHIEKMAAMMFNGEQVTEAAKVKADKKPSISVADLVARGILLFAAMERYTASQ